MSTSYVLLSSIRFSGRISAAGELEILTKRDGEVVESLDIQSDSPPLVRVQLHDFEHAGITWMFTAGGPWARGGGPFAWAEFSGYSTGSSYDALMIVAQSQDAAAQEKPKQIYIKIEPVVESPDRT